MLVKIEWLRKKMWVDGCRMALVSILLVIGAAASAESVGTTTVQGTIYLANGQTGSGTLIVSWPAFTTANGLAVVAGRSAVTIASDGLVSVALAPNQGASPAGLYYTAVYSLSDGTTSTEYWVVPVATTATLAQVRAQLMPAAQAMQTASKTYVNEAIASVNAVSLSASINEFAGEVTALQLGAVYQVDQFAGADFGTKLSACLSKLNASYGGSCDARNFTGSLSAGTDLTISTANATVLLPCATITTAQQLIVAAGTRNVSLRGCSYQGGSKASGLMGGTVWAYTGGGAAMQVGDTSYAEDTKGFHIENVNLNTASAGTTAVGIAFYRTQEIDLRSVYLNGDQLTGQTGISLDGTGNYTGGSFDSDTLNGFGTGVSLTGHLSGSVAGDFANASTFTRLHIVCPTASGSPISGTYGVNILAGDGNTWTGGDIESCATMVHFGANAINNTIVGLRNENSTIQYQADSGSAYNAVFTGGTFYTGKLIDNGSRNSFWDAFHHTVNGMKGDWYASQQDATVTNHLRLGTGTGTVRGIEWESQVDAGTTGTQYNWLWGLTDGAGGESDWIYDDLINGVTRLELQQNNAAGSNGTALNATGTGVVSFNSSTGASTGGVAFSSGGATPATVGTVDGSGNAQFVGSLQVGGTTQSTGTLTVRNRADAEVDYYLWPGLTTSQKGAFTYKDWNGSSQWYLVKTAANDWALNSAPGGLDSFKAYQSTNSGDTYVNASNSSGVVRINYESGSGTQFKVYGGSSSTLYAAFTGTKAIQFPGLAASSGSNCVQIDSSGYISNTGIACGSSSGNATIAGTTTLSGHLNQSATGKIGGSCTMAAATSCAVTLSASFTAPLCVATVQGTTPIAAACSISGTTATITAASSNSATWAVFFFGNPN
jgi:hypothetical protein